jgi:hypothetical protein
LERYSTGSKIFLLSEHEAEKYLPDDKDRLAFFEDQIEYSMWVTDH